MGMLVDWLVYKLIPQIQVLVIAVEHHLLLASCFL